MIRDIPAESFPTAILNVVMDGVSAGSMISALTCVFLCLVVPHETDMITCSGGVAIFATTFQVIRGLGRYHLQQRMAPAGVDWDNRWSGANGPAGISWRTLTQQWLDSIIANNE